MYLYEIGKVRLSIDHENTYMAERLGSFVSNYYPFTPDISIKCVKADHITVPEGESIISDKMASWISRKDSAGYSIYQWNVKHDRILVRVDTDVEFSNISITYLDLAVNFTPYGSTSGKTVSYMEYDVFLMAGIAFRNYLIHHSGLVIHASCISYKGSGIIFTAPSGTGKSTHVRLWEKHFGEDVSVLNDDTPALRLIQDQAFLCGTPWSGSTDKFVNKTAPLKAIVVLEQALSNAIKRLTVQEALPKVMPRAFLPYYDECMMRKANDTLGRLMESVPVYHLMCRPDNEAMGLVYKCVV